MNDLADYLGKNAAVLIVDMLNEITERGAIKCPHWADIVPNIKTLKQVARDKEIPIVYIKEQHRKEKIDFGRELDNEPEHCLAGSWGAEIIPELTPQEGDFVIIKRRYSAFFATDLDILLKGLGIDTVIVTGAATDCCVAATCLDAKQLDYKVVLPEECAVGTGIEQHKAFLRFIKDFVGKVVHLEELIGLLQAYTPTIDK